MGIGLALLCSIKSKFSKSFSTTIAVLPAIVAIIIIMVNGNLGTGIAVAGAFSLVKFRSAQGSAKEIVTIFIAMATGLILGMGYLAFAALFALIAGGTVVLLSLTKFGEKKYDDLEKVLKITIPEDLEYDSVFCDILKKYTKSSYLVGVKTTNMGSLFRLTYNITLKNAGSEKALIDDLRTRNGNLEISCNHDIKTVSEL